MKNNKVYRAGIRLSKTTFAKLLAICLISGETRTAVIEELIFSEFDRNRKVYTDTYYSVLEKLKNEGEGNEDL